MTAPTAAVTASLARPGGLLTDLGSVARRALRLTLREPEAVLPALIIPLFFFVVNVGALQKFVEASAPPGFSYKAFQLPLAIITAVTGVSRASSLVTDIQDGYFDRLLRTPMMKPRMSTGMVRVITSTKSATIRPSSSEIRRMGVRSKRSK